MRRCSADGRSNVVQAPVETAHGRAPAAMPADGMPGDPRNPVIDASCSRRSSATACRSLRVPLARRNIDAAIGLIRDLENLADVREITRLLTPQEAAKRSHTIGD